MCFALNLSTYLQFTLCNHMMPQSVCSVPVEMGATPYPLSSQADEKRGRSKANDNDARDAAAVTAVAAAGEGWPVGMQGTPHVLDLGESCWDYSWIICVLV